MAITTATGKYTKVATENKTALMTAYNSEAGIDDIKNYESFGYKNSKESRVVLFDGTTEVDTYYNYTANRGQILFDGDTYLNWSSGYKNNYWNFGTNSQATNPGSDQTFCVVDNEIFDGKSFQIGGAIDGWDGPIWQDVKLATPTNTFSMIIYFPKDVDNFLFEFYNNVKVATTSDWLMPTSFTYEAYEIFGEDGGRNNDDSYSTVEAGLYKMTFTVAETYPSIRFLEFRTRPGGASDSGFTCYIDNLTAEFPAPKHANVPAIYTGDSVSFEAPVLGGSNVFEGQGVAKAVQYRVSGAEGWTDLTATDGVYTINGLTEPTYEINVINQDNTNAVYVLKNGKLWTNNDGDTYAERGVVANEGYSGNKYKETDNNNFCVHHNYYGDGMMAINTAYEMYFNPYTPGTNGYRTMDAEYTYKIGVWAYSPAGGSWRARGSENKGAVWIGGASNFYYCDSTEIKAGYHYYEFTLAEGTWTDKTANAIYAVSVRTTTASAVYIDTIAYVK